MHSYGDGFQYFMEVHDAAFEIGEFCRKWGRICVTQTKEKYGESRIYCHFGIEQYNDIFYPGYVWIKSPRWFFSREFPSSLSNLIVPWQYFIYRLAYKRTIKKYPYICQEILGGADYPELLENL
jgi:hypothetical protein